MTFLSRIAALIDALNEHIGRACAWLVLIAIAISSANAIARYAFGLSSNAFLEIQWYLFALIFLFAAGYTHKHNGHVRVDVFYSHFSPRARALVDIAGGLFFLLPMSVALIYLSWTPAFTSYAIGETSPDPGGLLRWPIKFAIPLGFVLLTLQGISQVIKKIAVLKETEA